MICQPAIASKSLFVHSFIIIIIIIYSFIFSFSLFVLFNIQIHLRYKHTYKHTHMAQCVKWNFFHFHSTWAFGAIVRIAEKKRILFMWKFCFECVKLFFCPSRFFCRVARILCLSGLLVLLLLLLLLFVFYVCVWSICVVAVNITTTTITITITIWYVWRNVCFFSIGDGGFGFFIFFFVSSFYSLFTHIMLTTQTHTHTDRIL